MASAPSSQLRTGYESAGLPARHCGAGSLQDLARMGAYTDDALRQIVELREKGGELSGEQKQALVAWPQTHDDLRAELQRELEASGYDPRPRPLSAAQEAELRARGVLEEPSLLRRVVAAVRARFRRRR
jgi:hypothetical protein